MEFTKNVKNLKVEIENLTLFELGLVLNIIDECLQRFKIQGQKVFDS